MSILKLLLERVLCPGLREPGQTPSRVVAGIAIATIQNAQGDLPGARDVHYQRVNLARAQDRAFGFHLTVHQHLELDAAVVAEVVQADPGLEHHEVC